MAPDPLLTTRDTLQALRDGTITAEHLPDDFIEELKVERQPAPVPAVEPAAVLSEPGLGGSNVDLHERLVEIGLVKA